MTSEEIQKAIDQLPQLPLNELPTPLHFCPRLTEELGGPRIFVKRDTNRNGLNAIYLIIYI